MQYVIMIIIQIVMMIIQWAMSPRPKGAKPDSNLDVTPVQSGAPMIVIFGDVNVDPVTLWYGNPMSKPIMSGGKK